MFRFLKNKALNFKSRNLVLNLLEPLINKSREYCKGAVAQKNFYLLRQDDEELIFNRKDATQNVVLSLKFDENNKCTFYTVFFVEPGQSFLEAKSVNYRLVRERGLI